MKLLRLWKKDKVTKLAKPHRDDVPMAYASLMQCFKFKDKYAWLAQPPVKWSLIIKRHSGQVWASGALIFEIRSASPPPIEAIST